MKAQQKRAAGAGGVRLTRSALGRAFRLTAPAAVAAVSAIAFSAGAEQQAIGVGLAAAIGAGAAALLRDRRRPEAPRETPAPRPVEDDAGRKIGREIVEHVPLALFALDARGRVVFANAAASAEFGERLLGRHFSLILRAPALAEAVEQAMSERDAAEGAGMDDAESVGSAEAFFTLRGVRERHLAAYVRAAPASGLPWGHDIGAAPEDRRAALIIVIQDVTRARRAERLHRDFVANASHELKTPLASISGFVETLRGHAKDDPAAQERFLAIIAEQADRMIHLVQDLLSLNRIEINEHVPPRDSVDLRAAIEAAAKAARPATGDAAEGAGPFCSVEVPEAAPQVRGDARELGLLFSNLISNALKYGGEERAPRVRLEEKRDSEGRVGVTVEDFGPGIAKEHLPRLCERFYRVENGLAGTKSGTGLGLAIVKHVASRHRGALAIDSQPGRGSRFTVWLPLAESRQPRDEAKVRR